MKAKIILFLISYCLTCAISAQIPNSSFENWSGNEMSNWVSTNGLTFYGNPQTIFKSSDAHDGNYACEMIAAHITTKPSGVFVPDYAGSIFLGRQSFTVSTWGFPYTFKPAKVEYWFKFAPVGIDTANGIFFLTRWDSIQGRRDTIASAYSFHTSPDSVYTKAGINFTYYSTATPDSAIIGLASVALSCNHAGTRFLVDEISFAGGNVGLQQSGNAFDCDIYPNPSRGIIHVSFPHLQPSISICLYDLQGVEIWSDEFENLSETSIHTAHLTGGCYLLKIRNDDGEFLKKILVE